MKKLSWAEVIKSELESKVEKVPDGWKTQAQLSDELKVTRSYVGKLVARLLASGKAEQKNYVAKCGLGSTIRKQMHYRLKD
jgi:hypothetical protein